MIEYKNGPLADEIEVTLFGPGYGEAIAIHLGDMAWLLVDSCIDPHSKKPAAETYLESIGVGTHCVKALIASHWHDDHVRGFSRLATIYPAAELNISQVFSDSEAEAFLAAYNGAAAPRLTRGTGEMYRALLEREFAYHLGQRSNVLEHVITGQSARTVRVTALSPVAAAISGSIARMAEYIPRPSRDDSIGHAPEFRPNIEAVAIHIDWESDAVLLGADLEEDVKHGWTAVISDPWCAARKRANLYKIAHHGSHTGDNLDIWKVLVAQEPLACLTPFNLGSQKLPTEDDRERIRGLAKKAYISSGASRKPDLESEKLKRLSDICSSLSRVNAGFGATRFRKRFTDSEWTVELFGAAQHL
jgi:hypothetical protein